MIGDHRDEQVSAWCRFAQGGGCAMDRSVSFRRVLLYRLPVQIGPGLLIGQNGECNWTIPIPNNPTITGSLFYVQGFVADIGINPAGVVVSNGGAVLIGSH